MIIGTKTGLSFSRHILSLRMMEKFFFSFVISAFFLLNLYAQVQVGVRAGTHWSSVLYSHGNNKYGKFVPGFAVAGIIQKPLTAHWGICAEPSFIQKGWQSAVDYTTDLSTPAGTGRMILRYGAAELPLLVSFKNTINRRWMYYGLLGPSIGYSWGGRFEIEKENKQFLAKLVYSERRIETGVWGGGGIEFPIGGLTGFLDARYQYGLNRKLPLGYEGAIHGFSVSIGCWLPKTNETGRKMCPSQSTFITQRILLFELLNFAQMAIPHGTD